MKRLVATLLVLIFVFFTSTNVGYSENQPTREALLEETLMVKYLPYILEVTDKLFMCERITDIKRIFGNRQHELTIEVVTFEQAHSPPYD